MNDYTQVRQAATPHIGTINQPSVANKTTQQERVKYNGHDVKVGSNQMNSSRVESLRQQYINQAEQALNKSFVFRILPKSVKEEKINKLANKCLEAELTWVAGSKENVAFIKASRRVDYSPAQEKLHARIDNYRKVALGGSVTGDELKAKQQQFENDLIVLSNKEPVNSVFKSDIRKAIKELSNSFVEGRKNSLSLAEHSYEAAFRNTEANRQFVLNMRILKEECPALPSNVAQQDFSKKVTDFYETKKKELNDLKKGVSEDNALDVSSKLDSLKPKSYNQYSAYLETIGQQIGDPQINKQIALVKKYIDPDSNEKISLSTVEDAFRDIKLALQSRTV